MKVSLRRQLRAARRALSPAEHCARSREAARAVMRSRSFGAGRRVAVYLPFDRETDTGVLIEAARRRGVRLYVPIIVDRRHSRIRFYPLSGSTRRGAFGIRIPRRKGQPLAPRWFDLIVVPMVGVDGVGRRLGMGGGFYDRALDFRRRRVAWRGPQVLGFCFDCQRTAARFAESWDLRFDALATESGLRLFPNDGPLRGDGE